MKARPHHRISPRRPRLRLVHSQPDPRAIGASPELSVAIAETAADVVRADLARRGTQITPQTALDAVVAYVVRVRGFNCPSAAETITCTALEIIGQRELAAYATGHRPLPIRRRSARSGRPLQLEFLFPDPSRAA